jgi:Sulfotransferase domain
MIRINLISGPRNISTAIMYSFAQRADTTVLDEPYYAFYLNKSGVNHPGKEEVLKSQPLKEREVTNTVFGEWGTPVLFIKNMAHHIELMDQDFSDTLTNIFLIRNPKQIIASYSQVIETPTLRDIGLEYQFNLFKALLEKDKHSLVLDSGRLLQNPESILRQACSHIGIAFSAEMLRWQPGPKPYDGVWAKYWYANVHRSSGFDKQPTSNRQLPQHLEPLHEKAQYYYNALLPFSLQP